MAPRKVVTIKKTPNSIVECRDEADAWARDYVYELHKICKRIRKKCNPNIEQCNRWDMPRVVSACGTPGRVVICREGCGQTIRKKNCHK